MAFLVLKEREREGIMYVGWGNENICEQKLFNCFFSKNIFDLVQLIIDVANLSKSSNVFFY